MISETFRLLRPNSVILPKLPKYAQTSVTSETFDIKYLMSETAQTNFIFYF